MTDEPYLRGGWPRYYILSGHVAIAVDMWTWAAAFEKRKLGIAAGDDPFRVARTEINDNCHVSTVFVGLDHNFGRGDPLLFETMIFGGPLDQYQWRYATWDHAEHGHNQAVTEARKACAQVDAIAKNAGVKSDQ
jgi:hypothetical protein